MTCPCCGQQVEDSVASLACLQLKGHEGVVLAELIRTYPGGASNERLREVMYREHADGGPVTADKIVSITLWRAKKRLAKAGWTITDGRRDDGNRLQRLTGERT